MIPLSLSRAKELFEYNPQTGDLIRKTNQRYTAKKGSIVCPKSTVGYLKVRVDGQVLYVHTIIYLLNHGHLPHFSIDHIDGVKTNNRIENLRDVSQQDNCKNSGLRSDNTSGVVGVSYSKEKKKYEAYINPEKGKRVLLGRFTELKEAIKVRKQAEIENGYHSNHGMQS